MKTEKPRPIAPPAPSEAPSPAAPARPWEDRSAAASPRRVDPDARTVDRELLAWLSDNVQRI